MKKLPGRHGYKEFYFCIIDKFYKSKALNYEYYDAIFKQ